MDTQPMPEPALWRPKDCERVALVLQGGGALGAYQAGVYEALWEALIKIPEEALSEEQCQMRDKHSDLPRATILQLIYQKQTYEGAARDYEFSTDSMHEHWRNGYEDTRKTLTHKNWLEIPSKAGGIVTHDLHRDYGR
jgi:predicted acylesterase/phospholipase RssA